MIGTGEMWGGDEIGGEGGRKELKAWLNGLMAEINYFGVGDEDWFDDDGGIVYHQVIVYFGPSPPCGVCQLIS